MRLKERERERERKRERDGGGSVLENKRSISKEPKVDKGLMENLVLFCFMAYQPLWII